MQTIVLDGYAQVRDAYRSRDLEQALYDAGGIVMADSLLVLHGDAHRRRRRVENRLFRPGVFAQWERTFLGRTVHDALAPFRAAGGADLVDLGYRTVTTLTARVAGIDLPSGSLAAAELPRFARTFSEGATVVHTTRDPDAVRAEVRAALDEFGRRFLAPSIARRSELLRRGDEPPQDVLTALLRHRDELGLDDATILRESAFYLQAGSHSSVDAFVHAADDVFAWAAGDVDALRRDRALLQRCVHETLRLHPASPVARRRVLADVRLRDGTVLPAGTTVELDIAAANRDGSVFDRPDVYDPDRSVPAGVPRWGHAFGGGMHACIGTELAGGVPGGDRVPGTGEPEAGRILGMGGPEAGRVLGMGGPEAGRVLGTVTMMLGALLDAGGRPDPDDPPLRDPHSARDHFARYPVRLNPPTPDRPT